ncbi:hypothetical protein LCGC14_1288760 [marine sediment metagenome]|uniref:Uncharacterized protein n=1 Tax=marine sediment metagenome TaxID=412755 RepID=A0A0F9LE32_9ZZZZ
MVREISTTVCSSILFVLFVIVIIITFAIQSDQLEKGSDRLIDEAHKDTDKIIAAVFINL